MFNVESFSDYSCLIITLYLLIFQALFRSRKMCVCVCVCVCIYIYISSSSSCRAASTDLPDPLSPLISIVHRSREVFKALYMYLCTYKKVSV